MKCTIPEISWHNRDPVLSVDIQPKIDCLDKDSLCRLASGGTDSHVLIWYMVWNEHGSINLELAADLARHQRAVNVVKWSPNGEMLASGDDESVIFIWKLKEKNEAVNIMDDTNEQDKEVWISLKILRGHLEDIYDLSWSPNSQFLVSGSVDNTAIIWDVQKGRSSSILRDHKSFVQGVAWDPKNEFIATLSTDRYMRVFDIKTKKCICRLNKSLLSVPNNSEFYEKQIRLYHDDTLQTFFRRLCFSPDGNLIITPAGTTDSDGITKPINTTYIYTRYSLKQPSIVLPSPDEYTVAVKCCPILYKLNEFSPDPVIDLPYRMIFAVATKSSVYLYDTQQTIPFGVVSNIHYTRLSDLTWSSDGRILVVSSTDGFCSIITFEKDELGDIYEKNILPSEVISDTENSKSKFKVAYENESSTSPNKNNLNDNEKIKESITMGKTLGSRSPQKHTSLNETKASVLNKTPTLTKLQNFIIDKEVLSVDEKFHSPPGKKSSRQPTPIAVRRTPRLVNEKLVSEMSSKIESTEKNTKRNSKSLLSLRRQLTDAEAITEEAREAWPLPLESMEVDQDVKTFTKNNISNKIEPAAVIEISEDIQLVMEDTQTQGEQ